jgi:hypothetical protein
VQDKCKSQPRFVRHLPHPTVRHTASGQPVLRPPPFSSRVGDLLRGGRSLLLPSPAGHTVRIWFSEAGELILYQNGRNRRPESRPGAGSTDVQGSPAGRPAQAGITAPARLPRLPAGKHAVMPVTHKVAWDGRLESFKAGTRRPTWLPQPPSPQPVIAAPGRCGPKNHSDAELVSHALVVLFTVGGTPWVYYGDEQAYRGIKEDRAGGDDDIRPAFPVGPSDLSLVGKHIYRLHQDLIGTRRRHPWQLCGAA